MSTVVNLSATPDLGANQTLGVPPEMEERLNQTVETASPASTEETFSVETDGDGFDVDSIELAITAVEAENSELEALPEEARKLVTDEKLAELGPKFKELFGVDLKEAISNYSELVQTTQQLQVQLRQQQDEVVLQQQTLNVQGYWIQSDPAFLEEAKQAGSFGQATQNRIAELRKVYGKLSPEARQKLDAKGPVDSVVELQRIVASKKVKTAMPSSAGTQQQTGGQNQPQYKWSEIIGWDAKRYAEEGVQLIKSGNYLNDKLQMEKL